MSVEGIKNKVRELLTIENAKNIIKAAKDNAPSREEVETSIVALQDMMREIRSKAVQGVSTATTFYQKTIKSPEMETIIARVYKSKTPEERQRELEKILYLYMLKFGALDMSPPTDIDVMNTAGTEDFLNAIMTPDSMQRNAVTEMVKNLLLLFYNERMGVSVVEYGLEFSNQEMDEMFKDVVDERRRNEIISNVDEQVKNEEFMKQFLKAVIRDVPDKITDDSKYFGFQEDHARNMRVKVNNFINAHNSYITSYLKDGGTLARELSKLDRLVGTIQNQRGLVDDKHEMDELLVILASIRQALNDMIQASKGNEIRVREFKSLADMLSNDQDVVMGDEIVKQRQKRAREDDAEEEEGNSGKRVREAAASQDSQGQDGGKRRKTRRRKARKSRVSRRRKARKTKKTVRRKKRTVKRRKMVKRKTRRTA